jgi:hypothetical protein
MVFACSTVLFCCAGPAIATTRVHSFAGIVLAGVACPTSSLCEAVGYDGSANGILMPIQNGHAQPIQHVNGSGFLYGISCPTATTCVATGGSLVTITNGVPGTPQPFPTYHTSGSYGFSAISCGNATTCVTVGSATDTHVNPALVVVTNGTLGTPVVDTADPGFYSSVSCVTATHCEVVSDTGYATIDNGIPGVMQPIAGSTETGISCTSRTLCEIAGDPNGAGEPFVAQIHNGTLVNQQTVSVNLLFEVACHNQQCVAVGQDGAGGLVNIWSGVVKSVIPVTTNSDDVPFNAIANVAATANYETLGGANTIDGPSSVIYRYHDACGATC